MKVIIIITSDQKFNFQYFYFLFDYTVIIGLKKWVEVGNSGVFRPEMLLPMGLPPNVSVIAWGLSLERFAVISYDYLQPFLDYL